MKRTKEGSKRLMAMASEALLVMHQLRPRVLRQGVALNESEPERQLVATLLSVADQQMLYGSCDDARNETLMALYLQLAAAVVGSCTPAPTGKAQRVRVNPLLGLLDDYLYSALTLAAVGAAWMPEADGCAYCEDWYGTFMRLRSAWKALADTMRDWKPGKPMHPVPVLQLTDAKPRSRAVQAKALRDASYLALPCRRPQPNQPQFFMRGFTLVALWKNGRRRTFDLQGSVTQHSQLPKREVVLVEVAKEGQPRLRYIAHNNESLELVYDRQQLRHCLYEFGGFIPVRAAA